MGKKRTKKEEERLSDLQDKILEQREYVDVKPYSHNIIGINLRIIAKEFGYKEANKTIEELELDALGWKPVNK